MNSRTMRTCQKCRQYIYDTLIKSNTCEECNRDFQIKEERLNDEMQRRIED